MMALAKNPSYLAELFDLLDSVLAWVKDRQGRYLWVNRAFLINHALDHPDGEDLDIRGKILSFHITP